MMKMRMILTCYFLFSSYLISFVFAPLRFYTQCPLAVMPPPSNNASGMEAIPRVANPSRWTLPLTTCMLKSGLWAAPIATPQTPAHIQSVSIRAEYISLDFCFAAIDYAYLRQECQANLSDKEKDKYQEQRKSEWAYQCWKPIYLFQFLQWWSGQAPLFRQVVAVLILFLLYTDEASRLLSAWLR